jgi:GH24 family phage-related lysozyme (muramidase)
MMRFINTEAYDKLSSLYYLNRAINECTLLLESNPNIKSLILEENEPHFEWDFTTNKFYDRVNNIESDIKKSASYVRTAEQGVEFIKTLIGKVAQLPDKIKSDVIKLAIASMALGMGYNQLVDVENKVEPVSKETTMVSQALDNEISKKETKEIETKLSVSQTLIDSLKREEGIGGKPVLTAYDLGDGAYTIGYGHAVFANPDRGDNGGKYDFLPKYDKIIPGKTTITPEQAEILLKDDVKIASDGLDRLLNNWKSKGINPKINQPMYDAMVSMIYNMGIENFRLTEFIQLVKKGQFKAAAEEIKTTSQQMFNKYPGLEVRRSRESEMFKSGLS